MKLSIVIPVFNEENTIEEVIKKIVTLQILNVKKEVIIVNDGSTDATASKIKLRSNREQNLKVINHIKNLGKGAAVRTGIAQAHGDYILIQDADLEYDPKDIEKLIKPIQNGTAEVVFGTRLKRLPNIFRDEKTPLFLLHYFGNRFLSLITSVLYGQWITDMETGYKVFPTLFAKSLRLHAKSFEFEPEITAKILKNNYKILEVPIITIPRGYEKGKKLNTVKDGFIAFWTLIKYRFID